MIEEKFGESVGRYKSDSDLKLLSSNLKVPDDPKNRTYSGQSFSRSNFSKNKNKHIDYNKIKM